MPTKCVETYITATVVDPCDAPTGLTGFVQADKTYVIGDNASSFVHSSFTPNPSYCTVDYSYTIPALVNKNTPITVNKSTKTIKIDYIADLTPITEGPKFEVKITGTVKSPFGNKKALTTSEVKFKVTFTNPCLDKTKVTIGAIATPLSDQTYTIEATAKTFTHVAMTYTTSPRTHTLCGAVSYRGYTGTADASSPGAPATLLTTTSKPVAYNPATRTFTISSTDLTLKGKK